MRGPSVLRVYMPFKADGVEEEFREIDRWDGGVGWIAHPEETMERASHALAVDGEVWVIDPVDAPGVDDLLAEFGDVAGVVVALDRHKRDAAAVARRHDVSVYIPDWMTGVASDVDAPITRYSRELADTGYRAITIRNSTLPPWQEIGFYHPKLETLVVPEALGTVSYFCTEGEQLGVHPMLRLTPPKRPFRGLTPKRILVGHGEGVSENATAALRAALDNSKRRAPSLYLKTLRDALP